MGILDFLFGKKTSSTKKIKNKEIFNQNEYNKLKRETKILQTENKEWEKEFNDTISLREKAKKLEKENKLNEALEIYLNSINIAKNNSKLNIYNYAFDIDRVIILYSKTKQKEKLITFLEDKINKHRDFNKVNNWIVRLSKLKTNNTIKRNTLKPSDINHQIANVPTLGKQIEDFKRKMPEFNFYFDMKENSDTLNYSNNVPFELSKKLSEFKQKFDIIKSNAKVSENTGNYKTAIEAYEKMIKEECEDVAPYERLIVIYSKLKWKQEEIDIIERAITFFNNLKEKQLLYVNYLAKKYGMEDKAQEYISQNKKIYYYLGIFELYNPQVTRLNKWKERLKKRKQK
ncbi:hypothetical protein [Polaribacter sp. 20A6]|uniref:hypothetical protein n=1 Tax=Polaribacter sp. 20A6 TaxID=2687289 RepID=UPI0013FD76D1|nr:hypothetical protein [Polaribacter sp. 20A6]